MPKTCEVKDPVGKPARCILTKRRPGCELYSKVSRFDPEIDQHALHMIKGKVFDMITAEVICDSISEQGHRLTTMKGRCPKFIWQEFLTHRVFSRNASSSRAIPTAKYIAEVRSDTLRAAPIFWGKNQKGMQAVEELEGGDYEFGPLQGVKDTWRIAATLVSGSPA